MHRRDYMPDGFSNFIDLLAAKVPSWNTDYGSCRDVLAAAFPAGRSGQQQLERAMDDFMKSIEEALIDEVGFDSYCQRFAARTDNNGFSVLPTDLQNQYHASTPYEKVLLFWHETAPRRYLFHILTMLFGEIFGRQGADHVFRPLWRSFVHSLRSDESPRPVHVPAGSVAVASKSTPPLPASWNESVVAGDLQRLSGNVTVLGHYIENLRERFIIRQDVKTLNHRVQWLEAKLKELKIALDIQGTAFNLAIQRKEHELRTKQLALQHLQADGDLVDSIELAPLRKENNRLTLEAEGARLRKTIRELTPDPKKEGSGSQEQQKVQRHAASEARLQKLKSLKQEALKLADPEEGMHKVNAINEEILKEMEVWRTSL